MTGYRVYGLLTGYVKEIAENYIRNQMINQQCYQYIMYRWNNDQQGIVKWILDTYRTENITDQQASSAAETFVRNAISSFSRGCGQGNMISNGQMYQTANVGMYGNGMMMGNQYQGMMPNTMMQPMMGNYGGMYGNPQMNMQPQMNMNPFPNQNSNPYGSTLNVPQQNTQDYCASMLGEAAKPMPGAPDAQPQKKEEPAPAQQPATPSPWKFQVHVEEEIKEIHGVSKEKRKLMDASDEKTPVAITELETEEDFTDDLSAVRYATHGLGSYDGPQFMRIFFNRIVILGCGKELLTNFQKYLKEKVDVDSPTSGEARDRIVKIVNSIKSYFENMIGKDSSSLTTVVLSGMNYRGIAGEFMDKNAKEYSVTFSNLDDLWKADATQRILNALIGTIKDIRDYEILDLAETGVRRLVEDRIPRNFCIKDLDDVTDEKVIKETIDEVQSSICVVRRRRALYYVTRMAIPGVISGSKFDYIKSPTFFGTPDNSFEYLATTAFTEDHPKYGPIRMYVQAMPNQLLGYIAGVTTDNRMRLAPWTI